VTEDYCELCDLPLSTCVHGRPPAPPPAPVRKAPTPRATPVRSRAAAGSSRSAAAAEVSTRRVTRKWTPTEEFRPHVLAILRENDGRLDADDLMLELEVRLDDVLTPGDRETAPQGGERWHVAVRRQRKALADEGLLVPAQPGVWELTARGLVDD
jgi:hypothetical protein